MNKLKAIPTTLSCGLLIAVGLTTWTEAQASIPDATGVFTACYRKPDGRVRVIDTAITTRCSLNEVKFNWRARTTTVGGGTQGPIGPQGPTGPAGPIGPQGIPGPVGPMGDVGPAGPAGAIGPKGDPGIQGPIGETGAVGATGAAGAAGAAGLPGPKGDQGVAGAVGPAGPIGSQGLKGDTGAQGSAGATGAKGETGAAGPAGPAGPQGPAGTGTAAQLQNEVTVSASGGDFTSPVDAVNSILDASATNPYVVRIGPGVYDLGTTVLKMKPFVSVVGSGQSATFINGTRIPTNTALME